MGVELFYVNVRTTIIGASWFHKYINKPLVSGFYSKNRCSNVDFVWCLTPSYSGKLLQILNQLVYTVLAFIYALFSCNKQTDLVVASSPHPFAIFPAYIHAKLTRATLVYEVRDLWPLAIKQLSGKMSIYFSILKFVESFAVRKCDYIVSVKPGDKEYFKGNYGFDLDRFFYIPNGYLTEAADRPRRDSKSQKFVVGYCGAMSSYYCLDDLIYAAADLEDHTDIEFHLVGGGEDKVRLEALVIDLGLKNVKFLGRVEKTDVLNRIEQFDICYVGLKDIQANHYGISCNKLYEYMYMSKPIIANYTSFYDPVTSYGCGLTSAPGDVVSLCHNIIRFVVDEDFRVLCAQNSKHFFERNHDFKMIAPRYLDIIKK